ncbi:hypothetical protein WJX77_001934 [Trebouxia sp. C0004]
MASTFSKATTEARVMHKAVKKMQKNRPKKHSASDRKHKPAVYPAPPTPPPEYTVVSKPTTSETEQS